jgi:hypothetical protein
VFRYLAIVLYEGESVNRSQIELKSSNGRNRFSMCISRYQHSPDS